MGLGNFFRAVSCNGGWKRSCLVFWVTDDLKIGKYVGEDRMGNTYFENPYYFFSRDRWLIYSERFGFDYDGSQIDCRWFRWIHYMTDIPPTEEDRPVYPWMLPHTENETGTSNQYVPYSTTKPKIIPWRPTQKPCVLKS